MNTTITFDYSRVKNYAIELYLNADKEAYSQDKKVEALLALIGIDTGLRVSDLLNLKFSDISTDNEYGKPIILTYIKKKKRYQSIPITSTTNRLIEQYHSWCGKNCTFINEHIFFNYKSEKLYTRQWTHKRLNIANNTEALGKKVKTAGAHSLRRTAGHHIFDRTKDLRTVQFLLGHDRLAQTEHYLRLDEATAMEKLQRNYD